MFCKLLLNYLVIVLCRTTKKNEINFCVVSFAAKTKTFSRLVYMYTFDVISYTYKMLQISFLNVENRLELSKCFVT